MEAEPEREAVRVQDSVGVAESGLGVRVPVRVGEGLHVSEEGEAETVADGLGEPEGEAVEVHERLNGSVGERVAEAVERLEEALRVRVEAESEGLAL